MDNTVVTKISAKCHNLVYDERLGKSIPCNYVGETFVFIEELELGVAKFRCPDCGLFVNQKDSNFIRVS